MTRKELIQAARGERPLDLLIRNANLINVFTCEIYPADIGIYGKRFALTLPAGDCALEAKQIIDASGKWAAPGFIDAHLHIESSMVTPANYAAAVLPLGTTTAIIDPHEIANVLGRSGVRYMLEASQGLPLRVYLTIPTCVPAVPGKETSGAAFNADDIQEMLTWERVIAEGEVMDYWGVVNGDMRMQDIVEAGLRAGVTIQGHSPLLVGRELNAYAAAGIDNDHELREGEEGLQKLRAGILPILKLGSFGNHIRNILPTMQKVPFLEVALCTDDVHPHDILTKGHMDRVIREVIAHGINPALAYRWASLVGARNYHLKDHGAVAPGYLADMVLLDSLKDVHVTDVFVNGQYIAQDGQLLQSIKVAPIAINAANSMLLHHQLSRETFTLQAPIDEGNVAVNIIAYEPNRLTHLETITVPVKNGNLQLVEIDEDLCFLTVVPRHGQTHPAQTVVLKGLGWTHGTLALTIAHDSHNLLVAGHDPQDMLLAAKALQECGGGIALAHAGKLLGCVALPLAGLMSTKPVDILAEEIGVVDKIAREFGIKATSPALATVGLTLLVAPHVRLSDTEGLFDTLEQKRIAIFPEF